MHITSGTRIGSYEVVHISFSPDASYPVWSPDGHWLLFDRFKPEGGDIWMAEGIE
ncbi:MAG TPA: hypothetical protein VII32_14455 [Thermoanaerobaculia bacterium]